MGRHRSVLRQGLAKASSTKRGERPPATKLRFMERITGVEEPNISQWRRQNTGDLTGALNLRRGKRPSFPGLLPNVPHNYVLNQYVNSQDQNLPVVPAHQTKPKQEPGTRHQVP